MKSIATSHRRLIQSVAVIVGLATITAGAPTMASTRQQRTVAAVRHAMIAPAAPRSSSAISQDVINPDPTTSYDPGTDGWTLGDPYAYNPPVDPTTSYDPGTDGWTLGDPYAGSSGDTSGSSYDTSGGSYDPGTTG